MSAASPHAPSRPLTSLSVPPSRWAIALTGLVSLAVAMGIGRFAFTPLLPMMLHDGVTDLPTASLLASLNYLGYLVGALLCTFQPWIWRRLPGLPPVNPLAMMRAGLVATALLTLGMALPLPWLWPTLRFTSGVASAFVFVFTSGWCVAQLAQRQAAAMGGVMFMGPGAGIALSGLFVMALVAWGWRASAGWLIFGLLAAALTCVIWPVFGRSTRAVPTAAAAAATAATTPAATYTASAGEVGTLTVAYGLAGFGYIITATFLPVIARATLPPTPWLDMFWPIFGLGVMCGALLATRPRLQGDMRWLLAGCYAVQALGVMTSVWLPSLVGFALGSLLLGIPFTAITFFALQEVRRLRPHAVPSTMGLLTAMYGLGQILGPPLAAWLLRHSATPAQGFRLALEIAAAALLVGLGLYLWMVRSYPRRQPG